MMAAASASMKRRPKPPKRVAVLAGHQIGNHAFQIGPLDIGLMGLTETSDTAG
jgi:hypothetical protein